MAKSSYDFPEDTIAEILLRLPVKSLLRFRMVSKSWLSIISDPKFVESHCHIAAQENPKLLVRESLPDNPKGFEYVYMSEVFPSRCNIIGSCNGIACLSIFKCTGYEIYLWNPSIKQYKKLPPTIDAGNRVVRSSGFGYDSLSNDYKVVVIQYQFDDLIDFGNFVQRVQLFSANADSWIDLDPILPPNYSHDYSSDGLFINGVLYFELRDEKNKLISFDLHNEVFKVVLLPSCVLEKRSKLLDFEGSLALITIDSIGDGSVHQEINSELEDGGDRSVHREISLWMLEDGCELSRLNWIKKFRFEADLWVDMYLGAGQFYGESYSVGDNSTAYQIISHFWYDSKKKKCNYFHLQIGGFGRLMKYTESLVSFKGFESTGWLSQEQSRERLQMQEWRQQVQQMQRDLGEEQEDFEQEQEQQRKRTQQQHHRCEGCEVRLPREQSRQLLLQRQSRGSNSIRLSMRLPRERSRQLLQKQRQSGGSNSSH